MDGDDKILLEWIKEEIKFVLEITDGYDWDRFSTDKKTQHAVSMALINIGESVKSLNEELKQKNQNIEWRYIAGLRDIAAHNYGGLRMDWIWGNVTKDIPELLELVTGVLLAEEGEKGK
jgi:uncharacterized protein with HEPN domain